MIRPQTDNFAPAQESIDWAQEAIDEFQIAFNAFCADPETGGFIRYVDPDTGEDVLAYRIHRDLPRSFRRKATEAVISARHSFDQTLTAAIRTVEGKRRSKPVNYPWVKGPVDLQRLLEARAVPEKLWDTIKAQEPYHRSDTHAGGDDLIRSLATIANNKHDLGLTLQAASRRYQTTAGSGYSRIDPTAAASIAFLQPRWDPVNNQIELVRSINVPANATGKTKVDLEILLDDPKLAQPVNIGHAMLTFAGFAQRVLDELKAVSRN